MSKSKLPSSDDALDPFTEHALARLVHLHSGMETEDDWAAYEDWKSKDSANKAAADRAETLWRKLGPALARRRVKPKSIPIVLLISTGLIALIFGSGLFGPAAFLFADQTAGIGVRRGITLAYGSQVDIDSNTAFDVNLSAAKRELTLHTGRIFVTVAADKQRPFMIKAGGGVIRALGTAFGIREEGDETHVVVSESAVQVSYGETGNGVQVRAGQAVGYSSHRGLGQPQQANIRALTAWRDGQMIFDGRPLGDVAQEIERYRLGRIVFADADLKKLPVTGIFDADDTDGLLETIETVLPVKVFKLPGLVVLRRDGSRPQK